jgi:hypothetical protein
VPILRQVYPTLLGFSVGYCQRTLVDKSGIALMLGAVCTYETSVNFNVTTRRYIPKDSKLNTRRRANLQSHHKVTQYCN